jgi:hypothetical protein
MMTADDIKRLKDCLKLATPDTLYLTAKKGLELIAEIESLDVENHKQHEKIELLGKQLESYEGFNKRAVAFQDDLRAEIERLKQDYKDHTKILGDKLNDQIEYLKQDRETIKQLQVVRGAAGKVDWQKVWNIIHFFLLDKKTIEEKKSEIIKHLNQITKLRQALAAKR